MSYPAITLYELANCRNADLLRDAAEQRLIQEARVTQRGRASRLPGIIGSIRGVFGRELGLSAASARDAAGNTVVASHKLAVVTAAKSTAA